MRALNNLKTGLQMTRGIETTAAQFEQSKQLWIEQIRPLIGGEPVEAVAMFRQGGTAGSIAANRVAQPFGAAPQMLVRKASALARSKRAGGLPQRVLLVLTPTKLYAFDYSFQISRDRRVRENGQPEEAAVWERSAIRCTAERSGTMTALTIESPAEGEKATIVGGSAGDDPWSQDMMRALGALAP